MDVANLAVCLAPNILHNNAKSDKMNSTESKLLQTQKSIVQLLMTHSDHIGMVSNSLFERTALMTQCFQSEDELERSGETEETGKKKKKRRSGSLQGCLEFLEAMIYCKLLVKEVVYTCISELLHMCI